jgi:hypothetical protein
MKKSLILASAATLLVSLASSAFAAPITFPFRFADPTGPAQAVGSITFESTLLVNPGANDFFLPDPAVLALDVTVSGSIAGNGSFGITDFNEVVFDTAGGTLDFGSQLVGQPTSGGPWGTPDGSSGDFNLFVSGGTRAAGERYPSASVVPNGVAAPPNGNFFFTLGANGGAGENMVLTAMGAPVPPPMLPIGRNALLLMAGLLGLGGVLVLRRRKLRA